jgi:hypothetical protein
MITGEGIPRRSGQKEDIVMSVQPFDSVTGNTTRPGVAAPSASHEAFAVGLFALAAALLVNTVLGPLGTETIEYPISGTLLNQTIGLEAVTVALVVPLTLTAGVLALRGHRAAPLLGFGPAAYSAYMFVQYVLGPEYGRYTGTVLFQTVIFALSCALTAWAWTLASHQLMPELTSRRRRVYGAVLLVLGAFIVSRYLAVILGGALPSEFAEARTFFWSIFLLDLGVVVPATLVAAIALLRGARLAHPALYALMGWYALVPPSVAAMSATMVVNDDPHAAPAQAIVFGLIAIIFAGLAIWIFLPLLRSHPTVSQLVSRDSS